jgi:SAM-dependent methyltransferase
MPRDRAGIIRQLKSPARSQENRHVSDPETIRVYDSRAVDYAEMNDGNAAADPQLAAFIAACPTGGRVLDLGCGPGAAAAIMARAGLLVDATDASAEMVTLAGQHPGVTARQALFADITGTDVYDGIWASFSLLHAPRANFPGHLAALHMALKPGGAFYIALKLGNAEARDDIGRQYTYYSKDELENCLGNAGFTVVAHVLGQSIGLDGNLAKWISVAAHG